MTPVSSSASRIEQATSGERGALAWLVGGDSLRALARAVERQLDASPLLALETPSGLQLLGWPPESDATAIALPDSPATWLCDGVVRSGESLSVSNLREDLRFRRDWAGLASDTMAFLGVPLPEGRVRGALAVVRDGARHWSADDLVRLGDLSLALGAELERRRADEEREELEQALAHSEGRYRRLLSTSPHGIFALDLRRCIAEINRAGAEILGRSPMELTGHCLDDFLLPGDVETAAAAIRRAFSGEAARGEVELHAVRPNGERRLLRVSHAVIEEAGVLVGVQCVARDVTEERAKEVQLRRAERMASIAPMLSGVCHELNNPLTAIKSFAELMLLDTRPEEDREALEIVQREADRAAKIVSDLRVVARQSQEAGTGRNQVRVDDVIRKVLDERAQSLQRAGISVYSELSADGAAAWASAAHLEQVVSQLIRNAEQALQDWPRPREITVRSFRGGLGVAFLVADTGPGIPRDHLERIFDPFWTTKNPGQGTGLGLSLAHSIIADHAGRISVESAPGWGATFTVEIPLSEGTPTSTGERETAASASRGLRILVVDDEAPIRFSLTRYMERRGHQVSEAAEGGAALALLQQSTNDSRFDIIVADLRMPGLDGEQLLEQLRRRGDGSDQRLIFITGDAESPDADRVLRDAGVPVVWKPFELAEVAQIIEVQAGMTASP